jgi:hypothetical protein
LHVVDRHHDGGLARKPVEDRREGGRDHPLVGGRTLAAGTQQHAVDGNALHVGQGGEHGWVDLAQHVGDRRISQHGFGLSGAGREHPEAPVAGQIHRGQPDGGLADAGLALDDQTCRRKFRGKQELRYRPELGRATYHPGRHDPTIAFSKHRLYQLPLAHGRS